MRMLMVVMGILMWMFVCVVLGGNTSVFCSYNTRAISFHHH